MQAEIVRCCGCHARISRFREKFPEDKEKHYCSNRCADLYVETILSWRKKYGWLLDRVASLA